MGASLYDGLRPTADGASDMRFVDEFRNLELKEPPASEAIHFEVRLDKRLKRAAINWAKSHPIAVLRLAGVKFYRLWSPIPREPAFSAWPLKLLLAGTFGPLLLASLAGAAVAARYRRELLVFLIPALYVSLLHMIFVSSIRYRIPTLFGLEILAAYWLVVSLGPFLIRRFPIVSAVAARVCPWFTTR
ncbi:MAG: hypothetical protein HUK22_02495 [Thermoguttaceae bacterium]|nr:hypothetical protein [Thermoguttaceae bacterium]